MLELAPRRAVRNDTPLFFFTTYTVPVKETNAVNTIDADKSGTYCQAL